MLGKIEDYFSVKKGSDLDFNKIVEKKYTYQKDYYSYISRGVKNNGIICFLPKINANYKEFKKNCITVTLNGAGILTAFLQPNKFVTSRLIAVLEPVFDFSEEELIFFCYCINKNKFKFSSHGIEGNIQKIKNLQVINISEIKKQINEIKKLKNFNINNFSEKLDFKELKFDEKVNYFNIKDLFYVINGSNISIEKTENIKTGNIDFITASKFNEGIKKKINLENMQINTLPEKTFSLTKNGTVCKMFWRENKWIKTSDIICLKFKYPDLLNDELIFYLIYCVNKHSFKYNYGRKINNQRLNEINIPLPISVYKKFS